MVSIFGLEEEIASGLPDKRRSMRFGIDQNLVALCVDAVKRGRLAVDGSEENQFVLNKSR